MANELLVRGGIAVVTTIFTTVTGVLSHLGFSKDQAKKADKKIAQIEEKKIAAKAAELEVEELSEEMLETYKNELQPNAEECTKIIKKSNKNVIVGTSIVTGFVGGATSFGGYLLGNAIMNNANAESADSESSAPADAALVGGYLAPTIR